MHGDGTSLWTLTHHEDFARGFVPLLGSSRALGEAFHITSDDVLTWDAIAHVLAAAAGVEARIVHVTSDAIAAVDPEWGASLLGDKTHSMVFDNAKLRSVVPDFVARIPFEQGAREIVAWHDADPARRVRDPALDAVRRPPGRAIQTLRYFRVSRSVGTTVRSGPRMAIASTAVVYSGIPIQGMNFSWSPARSKMP